MLVSADPRGDGMWNSPSVVRSDGRQTQGEGHGVVMGLLLTYEEETEKTEAAGTADKCTAYRCEVSPGLPEDKSTASLKNSPATLVLQYTGTTMPRSYGTRALMHKVPILSQSLDWLF